MTIHHEILDLVVRKLVEADVACGIVVQGSVAEGVQRPDSDLDLFVVCSTDRPEFNDFIQHDNRGNMRIKGPVDGIQIDIGWQDAETLASTVEQNGAAAWYIFSRGIMARDPAGHATRCQQLMRDWFAEHPAIATAWAQQHEQVRKHKLDRAHPLKYLTFTDFYHHIQELVPQKD